MIGGNSLSLENLNSYVEIMRETERALEGIVVHQFSNVVVDSLSVKV